MKRYQVNIHGYYLKSTNDYLKTPVNCNERHKTIVRGSMMDAVEVLYVVFAAGFLTGSIIGYIIGNHLMESRNQNQEQHPSRAEHPYNYEDETSLPPSTTSTQTEIRKL